MPYFDNLDDLQAERDPEWESRIEADRVRAEWRCPITPTTPQRSLESLPLFSTGREEQQEMF
jgi:hypothetical protein